MCYEITQYVIVLDENSMKNRLHDYVPYTYAPYPLKTVTDLIQISLFLFLWIRLADGTVIKLIFKVPQGSQSIEWNIDPRWFASCTVDVIPM